MEFPVPVWLTTGMGLFALVAALLLLIEVAALKRVATGAAFTEHMSYVTGGILCLAASVLVGWVTSAFDVGFDPVEARVFADALVGVSMVLLGIYFVRLRRAILRFLGQLGGDDLVARSHAEAESEEPGA